MRGLKFGIKRLEERLEETLNVSALTESLHRNKKLGYRWQLARWLLCDVEWPSDL